MEILKLKLCLWDRNYGLREKKQYDDFLLMNVNNFKDFLTIRGISVSGYNKIELVAQAYSAAETDLPIILSSANLTKNLEEEYSKRLREFNILDPKILKKNHE